MMASANIPFSKLNNPCFRGFLEKYTTCNIPDESTLRKLYLPRCYDDKLNKIKQSVQGNKIWVSIDESTDVEGRYIGNVIVGVLSPDSAGQKFLLTSENLQKVNHSTIVNLFETSMSLLWPNGIEYENVMLFVTDAAPYIVKAAKKLKNRYKNMVHITCLAHGLHRVADVIRTSYPDVDNFIANTKKKYSEKLHPGYWPLEK